MKAILSLIDQALAVPGRRLQAAEPRATAKAVLGALAVLFVSFVLFVGSVSAQSFNTTNVLSAQSRHRQHHPLRLSDQLHRDQHPRPGRRRRRQCG